MIISLNQIVARHQMRLHSKNEIRDARDVDTLTKEQPLRVTIKRRVNGNTTTKRIYAGE